MCGELTTGRRCVCAGCAADPAVPMAVLAGRAARAEAQAALLAQVWCAP